MECCYHILKYNRAASVFGGEYVCTGIHLLDVTNCNIHKNDVSAIPDRGQTCTCEPVHPTQTLAEVIVPMIEQNRIRDEAARKLAIARTRAKYEAKHEKFVKELFGPLRPTLSGRLPEKDHPTRKRLIEEARNG